MPRTAPARLARPRRSQPSCSVPEFARSDARAGTSRVPEVPGPNLDSRDRLSPCGSRPSTPPADAPGPIGSRQGDVQRPAQERGDRTGVEARGPSLAATGATVVMVVATSGRPLTHGARFEHPDASKVVARAKPSERSTSCAHCRPWSVAAAASWARRLARRRGRRRVPFRNRPARLPGGDATPPGLRVSFGARRVLRVPCVVVLRPARPVPVGRSLQRSAPVLDPRAADSGQHVKLRRSRPRRGSPPAHRRARPAGCGATRPTCQGRKQP